MYKSSKNYLQMYHILRDIQNYIVMLCRISFLYGA